MVQGIIVAVIAGKGDARLGEWPIVVHHALSHKHRTLVEHTAHYRFHILESGGTAELGKLHAVARGGEVEDNALTLCELIG